MMVVVDDDSWCSRCGGAMWRQGDLVLACLNPPCGSASGASTPTRAAPSQRRSTDADAWSTFGHSPSRNFRSSASVTLDSPQLVFTVDIDSESVSSPAVDADGSLYVAVLRAALALQLSSAACLHLSYLIAHNPVLPVTLQVLWQQQRRCVQGLGNGSSPVELRRRWRCGLVTDCRCRPRVLRRLRHVHVLHQRDDRWPRLAHQDWRSRDIVAGYLARRSLLHLARQHVVRAPCAGGLCATTHFLRTCG